MDDLETSNWHICSIRTVESQVWIQLGRGIEADDCRRGQALRNDLNVLKREVRARGISVALHDDGFGLREVGKTDVVPARL